MFILFWCFQKVGYFPNEIFVHYLATPYTLIFNVLCFKTYRITDTAMYIVINYILRYFVKYI